LTSKVLNLHLLISRCAINSVACCTEGLLVSPLMFYLSEGGEGSSNQPRVSEGSISKAYVALQKATVWTNMW